MDTTGVIMDRAKDIVIRGGENIGCAEVEYAISEHPAVNEVSVFGVPDERLGEVPYAVVMLKSDSELRLFSWAIRRKLRLLSRVFFWNAPILPRVAATSSIARSITSMESIAF